MTELIKLVLRLTPKSILKYAEKFLAVAPEGASAREQELGRLVTVAIKVKNYDRAVMILNQIITEFPHNLEAKVQRMHLIGMSGSLDQYRSNLLDILLGMRNKPLPSIKAGERILRGIHYVRTSGSQSSFHKILMECTELAIINSRDASLQYWIFKAEILLAQKEYVAFCEIVGKFEKENAASKKLTSLRRICEKYLSPKFPNYKYPIVFGIGLSRTGTSSLNEALNIMGYHAIHWINPHTRSLIDIDDFFLFDAFTDIPVSYQFEELYKMFPEAKFVYTTRSINTWEQSIKKHYQNNRNISTPSELNNKSTADRFGKLAGKIEGNLYAQYPTWNVAFQEFDKRVRNFFDNKPLDKFLELRICEGEGWEKLCPFLEKKIPETTFPNKNQSPAHTK
jgi:hypothetical protein